MNVNMRLFLPTATCRLLLAGLFVLTSSAASAQTASGIGTRDCSAFRFALEKESEEAIDAYVSWAQGFISGFNWSNPRGVQLEMDAGSLLHSLLEYCGGAPGDPFHLAVRSLIDRYAR